MEFSLDKNSLMNIIRLKTLLKELLNENIATRKSTSL